jgi:glycolate oxidase
MRQERDVASLLGSVCDEREILSGALRTRSRREIRCGSQDVLIAAASRATALTSRTEICALKLSGRPPGGTLGPAPRLPNAILDELSARLPADRMLTDPSALSAYGHDEAEWAPWALPVAVVRPQGPSEVQAAVLACIATRTPIVPRGAGTGLSGGANAIAGCVVLSLEKMAAVLEVDPLERLAVVQPGVINDDLRAHVATFGLWYPPDPASSPWSTIGGNVATNAGGVCCVKYGVTRDYVLGLQVVTGTGELVRLGRRTAKGVAGYDLTSLIVGSEGTLGVVTEVTVRLRPVREPERTIAGYFASVADAGRAVMAVAEAGLTPSALELIDRHCLAAVDAWKNMGLSADAEVLLLAGVDTPGPAGDAEAISVRAAFESGGASWAAVSSDRAEADALFAARRLAYPALERLGPVLTEDVCVPIGAVPAMLARIEEIGARHEVLIANIAHAGDGNLHPLLITPAGDDAARTRAQAAFAEIVTAALELGGTVTGEHGVGLLKRHGLHTELSPAVLDLHHAVKAALDPYGILNPGKAI